MTRSVVISGLGAISGLGIGIGANWEGWLAGKSAIGPIGAFDPSGFACQIACEVKDFKVNNFVPKSYRKAVKVMARDIELAVAAADLAARDAGLVTKGTLGVDVPSSGTSGGASGGISGGISGGCVSYPASRMGANIGASLIACELDELTGALAEARKEDGSFDIHKWGELGMQQLTPLWLLKYLPNMLACHVTIIHDAQGPSNTLTCAEASSGLSLGEALRVIQRGAADVSFCGGAESKINPMAFLRQQMLNRLNTQDNDRPGHAVRPFCQTASGTVAGEAGGIVILEAWETFSKRAAGNSQVKGYARIAGFGASQTVNPANRNLTPDAEGKAIGLAIKAAMKEAGIGPDQIDLIVPFGSGHKEYDGAEAAALRCVFGKRLSEVAVVSSKPMIGNCGAAVGAMDVCLAAKALSEQKIPARINCDTPLAGIEGAKTAKSCDGKLEYALVYSTSLGGQNAAVVLKKM